MNRRNVPLEDRPPFGRIILEYVWSRRPPVSVAELARIMGIERQSLYNWIGNSSVPNPENLAKLAEATGISLAALTQALEASQGWEAPMPFADFYTQVQEVANAEHWQDKEIILPWLQRLVAWQDESGEHVTLAKDVLRQKVTLYQKAVKLTFIVRSQHALQNNPPPPPQ